jgi:hypothetical protein
MSELRASSLVPFIPGGKDYAASRRLFAALGFEEHWESGGYAGFKNGAAEFILQDFRDDAFASNLMMKLVVPDLDRWWGAVSRMQLERSHPGLRMKPPTEFPWGREVHLIDLAGVCWHVSER